MCAHQRMCSSVGMRWIVAEAGLVVPREVGVRLDQAGHEGGAAAVHRGHAAAGQGAGAPGHAGDAIALHQHLAGVGRGAAGIEDPDIGEEDVRHGLLLSVPRAPAAPCCARMRHVSHAAVRD